MKAPLLVLGLVVWASSVEGAGLARTNTPAWVSPMSWSPKSTPEQGSDYQDFLRDNQVNVATQEEYTHFAFRYLTAKGVQNDSTLRIDYEPDYQTVQLHTLILWRDGKAIDQKNLQFRSLQRETELEQAVYDGGQTWVGFLKDVRVGDVLEVAYTIQGFNPIFGGRFADSYRLESGFPVDRYRLRVVAPAARRVDVRPRNTDLKLSTVTQGTVQEVVADYQSLSARVDETDLPGDVGSGGRFVLSEWPTWSEVARWALPLYKAAPSAEVTTKAKELVQGVADRDGQLEALLAFVQDRIRYLGIEVGVNSHQPHPAEEVLSNGFGDCKDKAVLFCSLAASLGWEAWPVLVHTWAGLGIPDNGPTPLAFNHVIAAVNTTRGKVFVDPTADYQGGPIDQRALGAFGFGLEVKAGVEGLTAFPTPVAGQQNLVQTFHFKAFEGEARVTMEYSLTGAEADSRRREMDHPDLADWRKNTNERLHDEYGDAQVTADPTWTDDRKTNTFTLRYEFTVKDYWKKKEGKYRAEFYPYLVGDYLYDPHRVGTRTLPYAIDHPIVVHQVMRIELPDAWKIEDYDQTVIAPGLRLRHQNVPINPRLLEYIDDFESTSDRITPGQWTDYLAGLKKARAEVSWQLTSDLPSVKPASTTDSSDELLKAGAVVTSILVFLATAALQGPDF